MNNLTIKLQSKLLEVMKMFHEVCEKNEIEYYMLGGTMLGAVRHEGFIPWDDDMDVGIPRKDYEKLLSLPQKKLPKELHLKTPMNSNDLIFPYSKIMDKRTTLIEDRLNGIVEGIYIDIFPLDGAGNNFLSSKFYYYIFYWKRGLLYYNQELKKRKNIFKKTIKKYAQKRDVEKLYQETNKWMSKRSYRKSSLIGNFSGAWGLNEFMPKKYLGTPKLYKFENNRFYGPEDYDAYLRSLYGDYMKLPPEDQRKSHHNFKHIDLETPYSKYRVD